MKRTDDRERWLRDELRHFRSDLRALVGISFVIWLVGGGVALVAGWDRATDFVFALPILLFAALPLMHLRTEHRYPNGRKELGRWLALFAIAMGMFVVSAIVLMALATAIGLFS